jgi:hypothetical protein
MDSNNEMLFVIVSADFKSGVTMMEFRRPMISFKYTLTNKIDKNAKLYSYVD